MGCQAEKAPETHHYLHLSHTRIRDKVNQKIDPRAAQLDFGKFDLLLLGGDLTINSSKKMETLEYLDGIFHLGSPDVMWALGNHDDTNLEYVRKITRRPTSYAYHKNGITFLVLNTQNKIDWKCQLTGPQLKLVHSVTDTIKESSHLIVLTHNLLWLLGHPEMSRFTDMKNLYNGASNKAVWKSNWKEEVLPCLQRTVRKGVEVICLAGDIGNNVKSFEFHAADGITYLASGINPTDDDVEFLLFKHQPPELNWEFVELEKYLAAGQKWGQ